MGMLLCLDRAQRLIFTLGAILGVSDVVGAELLEISRDNFRQCLARARRDLHNFMNNQCGLVNRAIHVAARRRRGASSRMGYVDPENLLFAHERVERVREIVQAKCDAIATLDEQHAAIFRDHPFYEPPDLVLALRRLVESPEFRDVADLP